MLAVPQIGSDIVEIIINVMTENMREVRLVCKNILLNILIVKGQNGFLYDVLVALIDKTDAKNPIK